MARRRRRRPGAASRSPCRRRLLRAPAVVPRLIRERGGPVLFAHLVGSRELLAERMGSRSEHFMPPTLLDSQLATLEPLEPDEAGLVLDIAQPPDQIADAILSRWLAMP